MSGELSGILDHVDRISRARPRRGRADLARGRARERAAPRRAAAEPGRASGRSSRRPTPPTAPSASPRRRRERPSSSSSPSPRRSSGSRPASSPADEYFDAYARGGGGRRAQRLPVAAPRTAGARAPEAASSPGVPIAVKDIFCTEGIATTAGSRILEGYVPPYTATAVAQARRRRRPRARQDQHGRVRDGLVERELRLRPGAQPVGPRAASRAAPRAARRRRSPARLAPWAIGTDTGGSIRQPAALCGIVGMKPTYGAISRYGMIAFASSLDQCGPLTRDVTDAALLLRAMEGRDPLRLDLGRDRGRGRAARRART